MKKEPKKTRIASSADELMSVGELLQMSLGLYRANFSLLAGYAAWILLPYATIVFLSFFEPSMVTETVTVFALMAHFFIIVWIGIIITMLTTKIILQQKIPLSEVQNAALQLISPVLVVAFLEFVVFTGGFLMLVIPGIIFTVWFFFSTLAVILEGIAGTKALTFSRELVRGRFWQMFGRIFLGPIFIFLTYLIIIVLVAYLVMSVGNIPIESLETGTPPLWMDVLGTIVEVFASPLFIIYFVYLYLDVRKLRPDLNFYRTQQPDKKKQPAE